MRSRSKAIVSLASIVLLAVLAAYFLIPVRHRTTREVPAISPTTQSIVSKTEHGNEEGTLQAKGPINSRLAVRDKQEAEASTTSFDSLPIEQFANLREHKLAAELGRSLQELEEKPSVESAKSVVINSVFAILDKAGQFDEPDSPTDWSAHPNADVSLGRDGRVYWIDFDDYPVYGWLEKGIEYGGLFPPVESLSLDGTAASARAPQLPESVVRAVKALANDAKKTLPSELTAKYIKQGDGK